MSTSTPSFASASSTAGPSVTFHPSVATMNRDVENDSDSEIEVEQRRSAKGGKQGKNKQNTSGGNNSSSSANAAGNNSSEPIQSGKAKTKAKQRAVQEHLQEQRRRSSRSPSAGREDDTKRTDRVPNELITKKRPMRSVEDVINRIKHDPIVLSDKKVLQHFVIAYIDRVFGDQEIAFEEFFTNEDFKEIPLHRISYLRYCDEIIWNRALKYDAVFGSSNTTDTLQTWLDRTDELVAQQHERWAHLLAEEREQEAADELMLRKLGHSIEEQKETIAAMQGELESRSVATSGFDFGEDRQKEFEGEEEEPMMEDVQEEPTPVPTSVVAAPTPAPAPASVNPSVIPSASSSSSANPLESLESLPARAPRADRRGGKSAPATKPAVAASSHATSSTTAPVSMSASAPPPVAASSTVAATAPLNSSDVARPLREDDGNIEFQVTMFDPLTQRLQRTVTIRAHTAHFDWAFLKKRIASRMNLRSQQEVRRLYISGSDGAHTRLNEENFQSLLHSGAEVILMAEIDAKANPAALFDQPKKDGHEESQRDKDHLRKVAQGTVPKAERKSVAQGPAASVTTSAPPSAPASKSSLQRAVQKDRPNYFISLRITSPRMLESLIGVQASLVKYDARYKAFLVPTGTFHITLSLLCVHGDEDLKKACTAFEGAQGRIREIMNGDENDAMVDVSAAAASIPTFPVRGLSSFGGRVLYADIPVCPTRSKLNIVAGYLAQVFEVAGVGCSENKKGEEKKGNKAQAKGAAVFTPAPSSETTSDAFTPHLTIAKLSRAPKPRKGREHKGGSSSAKSKDENKPPRTFQPQQQNTGIIEMADDREPDNAVGSGAAESDVLPSRSNAFASLARDNSTASSVSVASSDASSSVVSSSSSVPPVSTSVIRRLDAASYAEWKEFDFGEQSVMTLDLCAMTGVKQPDGYYQVKAKVEVV